MTEKFIDLEEESIFGDNKEVRELNDDDMDLDQLIDQEIADFDLAKFENELLFAVQGLGGKKTVNGIEFYHKGKDCLDCLKDLLRACKKDDPEEMLTRQILGKWNIVQSDLLQLLITQPQDKLLSFYVITLLYYMTESPCLKNKQRIQLIEFLRQYKQNFLTNEVVKTLVLHLEQCLSVEGEKTKGQVNMIIAIVGIFRNILQITDLPDSQDCQNEIQRKLHYYTLIQFIKEGAMDALIFLSQDFTQEYNQEHSLEYLELFYHIFSSFDVEWLVSQQSQGSYVQQLMQQERLKKEKEIIQAGLKRHSKFGANYQFIRSMDKTAKMVSNVNAQRDQVINKGNQQLYKPQKRKVVHEHLSVHRKKIREDGFIQEDLDEQNNEIKVYFKEAILGYANNFLVNSFQALMTAAFDEIYKIEVSDKEKDENKVHYFVMLSFFMKFTRIQYSYAKQKDQSSTLNINDLVICLELTQFELMYRFMIEEATRKQKKGRQFRIYHSVMIAFLELLYLVKEMSLSTDSRNRQNSKIILGNIFSLEMTRILQSGIGSTIVGILNDEQLKTQAEIIGVYFELLEQHSKGKVFTVTTNKRLKKKKVKQGKRNQKDDEEDELKQFIEQDGQEQGNEDEDYDPEGKKLRKQIEDNINIVKEKEGEENNEDENEEEDEVEDEEQKIQYEEVQMNINTVFAGIVNYDTVQKMLYLIDDEKILKNNEQLNQSIFSYIKRIVNNLQAEFMFYQIDFLEIFNRILSNPEITSKKEIKQGLVFVMKKVIKNYFKLLKKNPLLIVESLFRFPNRDTIMNIQNNYEDLEGVGAAGLNGEEIGEFQQDPEDDDDHMGRAGYKKRWCMAEDKALVENYEMFQENDNCFEKLEELLNNLNFYGKNPNDIRKRVKKLKLDKGKAQAEEQIRKIYDQRLTLEQAIHMVRRSQKESYTSEELGQFLDQMLDKYIQFLDLHPQSKFQAGGRNLEMGYDYSIVPIMKIDFDILECEKVQQILECMEFRGPVQGEWTWKIPVFIRKVEAELYKEKIGQYFSQELPDLTEQQIKENEEKIRNMQLQEQMLESDNEDQEQNNKMDEEIEQNNHSTKAKVEHDKLQEEQEEEFEYNRDYDEDSQQQNTNNKENKQNEPLDEESEEEFNFDQELLKKKQKQIQGIEKQISNNSSQQQQQQDEDNTSSNNINQQQQQSQIFTQKQEIDNLFSNENSMSNNN